MHDQSEIGFEQVGIGELLKRYRLVVPPHQRDYAWEDEQVSTLFEDLSFSIQQNESSYFLGTIVTVPVANGVLQVIDGQQRLATTTLALAAMRHRVVEAMPNLARALDDFLTSVDSRTLEHSPKMQLNTADTDVFHCLVTEGALGTGFIAARQSHDNLSAAYKCACRRWESTARSVGSRNEIDIFREWMSYIEYNAKVILLRVPSDVNAFKMFETLNDRGLKTSQADLVKNYVFGQAGDDLSSAQEKWGYIRGSLEAIDEEDITVNFLRQALICQQGYLKESQVYDHVQNRVRGQTSAREFLMEIDIQARDYASLFNVSSSKWSSYPASTKKSLETLFLFNIRPFRPLLLSIVRRFSAEDTDRALKALVSLGVRLIIASSTRSGSVEQPLAKAAQQIFTEDITGSTQLFQSLVGVIPSDDQFREAFLVARVSNSKFARYYSRVTICDAWSQHVGKNKNRGLCPTRTPCRLR